VEAAACALERQLGARGDRGVLTHGEAKRIAVAVLTAWQTAPDSGAPQEVCRG
jgi:hypothetical protein